MTRKQCHCSRCGGSVEWEAIADFLDELDEDELEAFLGLQKRTLEWSEGEGDDGAS